MATARCRPMLASACLWLALLSAANAQGLFSQPPGPGAPPQAPLQVPQPLMPNDIEGQWVVQQTRAVLDFRINRRQIPPQREVMGDFWYAILTGDTLEDYRRGDAILINLRVNAAATQTARQQFPDAIVFSGLILNPPERPGQRGTYGPCNVVLMNRNELFVSMPGIAGTVPMKRLSLECIGC